MKHIFRTAIVMMALMIGATESVWATIEYKNASQSLTVLVNRLPNEAAGSETVVFDGNKVTITVTPTTGYTVSKIEAQGMIDPSAAPQRAPGMMDNSITVTDKGSNVYEIIIDESDYSGAYVTIMFKNGNVTPITDLDEITNPAGDYELVADVDASGFAGIANFTGTLNGNFHIISNLSVPLFTTIDGGTVKNVTFENVDVETGGDAGAVACEMIGTSTKIAVVYNCGILSGSVKGGSNSKVGGLIGKLGQEGGTDATNANCYARVINCYSFANIESGYDKGGIVGYNCFSSKSDNIRSMVMNCMFYGDIVSGSNVSPVYGGEEITNVSADKGLNTYTYYRFESDFSGKVIGTNYGWINKQNCSLAVEEKYLVRFEFYRQLLNGNRPLAAWYALTDEADGAKRVERGKYKNNEMAKWVLDRTIAPYPILKKQGTYYSVVNYDPNYTFDEDGKQISRNSSTIKRSQGKYLGKSLSITISEPNTQTGGKKKPDNAQITVNSLSRPRIDKDTLNCNFNYDKVQLPYYNEVGTGNYTKNTSDGKSRVVTGWMITKVTTSASDENSYTAANYPATPTAAYNSATYDAPNYNFADRNSSQKDLYTISGRVFSQGAYFDVPYNVTGITIEPYWGDAAYVSDSYLDVTYTADDNNKTYKSKTNAVFQQYATNNTTTYVTRSINGVEQNVYTSIDNALGQLGGSTVYDNAVVLVGNLHQNNTPSTGTKAFTMMSADLDFDNEPDYSMIYHHSARKDVAPIRYDFLNIPGTAMTQKPKGANCMLNMSIYNLKGWFEVTNTCNVSFVQFEYYNGASKVLDPVIFQGGMVDQFVSTKTSSPVNTSGNKPFVNYIHVGGNAWFNDFGNGTHSDGSQFTPHIPISVTGGDFENFYLSGTYKPNAAVAADNAECYISGGRFGELAGAAQQQINGNVKWQIYDADIRDFFGGGINAAKPITGDITVNIYNSHVTTYCGGPKFGDMAGVKTENDPNDDKTVRTTAEGCTFGRFFGAGYGGTSYLRQRYYDEPSSDIGSQDSYYTTRRGNYYDGVKTTNKDGKEGPGIAADFDYELFTWSDGRVGSRFYVKFASFSLAKTNDVHSKLTNCTVIGSFYGGGHLGEVTGTAYSELDGCKVYGNVFGGGYSAEVPKVPVRDGGFSTAPKYLTDAGVLTKAKFSDTHDYVWTTHALPNNGNLAINPDSPASTGNAIYTTDGLSTLGQVKETQLTITGNTYVRGMIDGTVPKPEEDLGYSGIDGKTLYGVATDGKLIGGVFGGGDASKVSGNASVSIVNTISTNDGINNVYGGGNTADVLGDATVSVVNGKMIDVYGGGRGDVTVVKGDVTVHIGKSFKEDGTTVDKTGSPTISGNVYGGSALGVVNAESIKDPDGNITGYTPIEGKTTAVNIYGCTSIANVFGGGLGQLESGTSEQANYKPSIAAQNFGDVTVTMEGGKVNTAIYGGSNENGVLKGKATVTLKNGTVGTAVTSGEPNNVVFGGGKGQPTLVEGDVEINIGETTQTEGGATINGSVYGGSALGNVNATKNGTAVEGTTKQDPAYPADPTKTIPTETTVTLNRGTVNGDVYGGGLGNNTSGSEVAANVYGPVTVTVNGGTARNVFGCNNVNGAPQSTVEVNIVGTSAATTQKPNPIENVYGGGNQAAYTGTPTVTMTGGIVGNLFGGGLGLTAIITGNTSVTLSGGTVNTDVYGGGSQANMTGNVSVNIEGGTVNHDVYGGGAKAHTNTGNLNSSDEITNAYYEVPVTAGTTVVTGLYTKTGDAYNKVTTLNETAAENTLYYRYGTNYTTTVNLTSGTVKGDAYGGGLGEAGTPGTPAYVYGDVAVILNGTKMVTGYTTGDNPVVNAGRVFGCNNVKGSPKGHVKVWVQKTAEVTEPAQTIDVTAVFGGGNQAPYEPQVATEKTDVEINRLVTTDRLIVGNVFGGGNEAGIEAGTEVLVISGDVKTAVYGGCNASGTVSGDTHVAVTGGTIGEGTLNLAVTPKVFSRTTKGNVFGGGYGKQTYVAGSVIVNIGESGATSGPTIFGDVYGGGALGHVNGTKAASGAFDPTATPTTIKTTVNLYSGTIYGDAYGGGLGEKNGINSVTADYAARVGGDIHVTLNGTAFIIGQENTSDVDPTSTDTDNPTYIQVVNSGRVFGSNNLCGSPDGDIYVTVEKTVAGNKTRTSSVTEEYGKKLLDDPDYNSEYELAAVYGGGNLASFTATNKKTIVLIKGCDDTSIETVYGGGNAAAVPETDVKIQSAYELGTVFGGGNGKDKYYNGTTWVANPGANISGDANTVLYGGVTHEAYGGSNKKGTISGNISIDMSATHLDNDNCDLVVGKFVGAGKDADAGGVKMIVGCKPNKKVPLVYFGADNANINGNVEVTITSGNYGKVFAGNNEGGAILGKIILNIEETGNCETPITIDDLYLGGNEAAYSVYGYYKGDDGKLHPIGKDGKDANGTARTPVKLNTTSGEYENDNNFTPYANPILNVISCTRIDNIFGGGFGTGAIMYADPTVNINMIPGSFAENTTVGVPVVMAEKGLSTDDNPRKLGIIGNVYGGGDAAEVIGETTVNIGNLEYVEMTSFDKLDVRGYYTRSESEGSYTYTEVTGTTAVPAAANTSYYKEVVGAYITGNVFGAGKGKETDHIAAMVRGNSTVNMAGGTVKGNIYGGGELSSVGDFTYNDAADVLYVITGCAANTGTSTVNITGGSVGTSSDYTYNEDVTQTTTPHGNVFAGSKGELKKSDNTYLDNWLKFARVKNTVLNVSGGTIMSNIYGGGEIGLVGYKNSSNALVGSTTVTVSGGTIGTEITSGTGTNTVTHYTIGSVFGGGYGSNVESVTDVTDTHAPKLYAGRVYGSTSVTMTGGTVKASVYGGGQLASVGATDVGGDAVVAVSGGTVGIPKDGDKQFGGALMGNVYGGGSGDKNIVRAGQIFGNTTVTISGTPTIYHNIYGGGAYGSVGDFDYTTSENETGFEGIAKVVGINRCATGTGTANVTVTGGTIGVDGKENGMVFGSSRGDVGTNRDKWQAWVYETNVVIGENTNHTGPTIKGSVYGSGENGHVYTDTEVEIHGGTIGIYDANDVVKDGDGNVTKDYNATRGNVYGGGCGEDTYPSDTEVKDKDNVSMAGKFEPSAGIVYGTAKVTMTGGTVLHNIYGAGALGSVGKPDNDDPTVIASGGSTIIAISGGTVGDDGTHGDGNVFGAARGNANAPKGVAQVKSTGLSISNGIIYGNVYGGGALGDVGTYTYDDDTKEYTWDKIGGQESGDCSVEITGGTVKGHVFGAGKGEENTFECEKAMVRTTSVSISAGTVEKNVYGGGEVGRVDQDAAVTVGPESGDGAPVIKGNVFGAGAGVKTHGYSALVRGNTTVIVQGSAKVGQDVYGGGQIAAVGRYGLTNGMPTTLVSGGECKVTVKGNAEIGTDGEGHVFGAGMGVTPDYYPVGVDSYENNADKPKRMMTYTTTPARVETDAGTKWDYYGPNHNYVWEYLNTRDDYLNFLQTLALVTDTKVSIEGSAKVHGSVYGGSKSGFVQRETDVKIKGGTILTITDTDNKITEGNVFGGGKGLSGFDAAGRVRGDATTTISGGTINGNVYGGGELGFVGTVTTTDHKNYTWYKIHDNDDHYSGLCTVTISNASVEVKGNVFGASKGKDDTFECEQGMTRTTSVSISAGTVDKNVYGGGEVGRVDQDAAVTIGPESGDGAPVIKGNVFGAGAGVETHGYSALVRGDAEVIVQGGAKVGKNVYGGGEIAAVGRYGLTNGMPTELVSGGECKVTIKGNAEIGTISGGLVFGAGMGVDETKKTYTYSAGNTSTMPKRMMIYDTNVYKSGYENPYEVIGNTGYVWEYYPTRNKYLAFLQTLALATDTKLSIEGNAKVKGSVYGGSESGFVQRDTEVKIQGATGTNGSIIDGNIYGGGKGLSGFDEAGRVRGGVTVDVSGSTMRGSVYGGGELGIVVGAVKVDINNGTIEKDVYGGGALANTNTNNWDGTTLTETYLEACTPTIGTSVVGYYTKSGDNYNEAIGTAAENTTYYRKVNTSVNLLGGIIKGDAYGGGLGQLGTNAIEAKVYGDVTVTLGDDGRNGATAFYVDKYTEGTHAGIVKSGRVFGCNNLNGSPQGGVTVKVNKTEEGNTPKTASGKLKSETASDHTYHVAAVYGGGNLAGKTVGGITNVIINGCDVSIRQVYGGGNAAEVPGTDVLVNGSYEIEQVFGGGNGKDDYTLDGGAHWTENPGADVNGNTNTIMKGGLIHEAYGGSNEKGTITGSVSINTSDDRPTDCDCELDVEKIVGAGKNADVNGDLIMVLGCKPTSKTPLVFGGADNANVNGNVELTITSGTFGQVFGGNNLGGIIKGHILLNIEETGCNPIKIDELYLGGNQAAYSVYGYYDSGTTNPTTGKKIYLPRTSASDSHTADPSHADDATHSFPYADPVLNVVSCTSIGKVFGGGLGEGAVMYADPTVNINMIPGAFASDDSKGVPFVMNEKGLSADDNPKKLGIIGDVYGGGNAADVIGNPTVNIGTAATVQLHQSYSTTTGYVMSDPIPVEGAYINGNVFGGGMGSDDTYECEKAMVGINGDGEANPDGGTTVNIGNGVVMGSVYGGGEIGRVEKNSVVTIGLASGTSTPLIKGNVFGGGKGKETHGYAALLRGNPTVTIQADAKVLGNVYGGGEIASVARYKVPKTPAEVTEARAEGYDAVLDMPYALKNSTSGYCKVTVKGNAEIGPDNMKMYHADGNGNIPADDKPDDAGHVFAAGKGILPKNYPYGNVEDDDHMPKRMINENGVDKWQWFHSKADYVKFIQTLALSSNTEVTIEGNAFVKGSVYGGSENGLVQYDTKVYIKGGQIGNGDGVNRRYTDAEWSYDGSNDTKSLAECASWPYEAPYAPYDPNANATGDLDKYSSGKSTEGGRRLASDGHTYYGNVFGGGSGSVPYFDTDEGISKYLNSAGTVKGNTHVEISGGHILTSVYGGCEATNVQDTAYVTMTGGTVGVPRTLNQINNHPVTCYVFGGGKGDQRIFFNKDTNVGNAVVDIQGGRIYGSVFGGGEDGHVMRNVALTIGNDDGTEPTIGTWGTTYVDGNVFGGGRGFGGEALTAGNIGGSVTMNIKGGTMLGSIYGGGRLGSVGYGLYLVDEVVGEEKPYGVLRPDGVDDNGNPVEGFKRGYITINISGGTIGNEHEYKYYAPDVELTSDMKTAANIPNTTFDYQNHLLYTKGGNVFTGCMGRLYALDGSLLPLWPKLGKCKETVLNITGGIIKSSVYGGGEIGAVQQKTTVNVTGGTVGTKVVDSEDETKYYYFGSVFGGGKGSTDAISYPAGTAEADKVDISEAGTVGGNVLVELNKGVAEDKPGGIVNQVFGCNDMNGSPKGMVDVHIYATQTVGKSNISTKLGKELGKYDVQAVYGGGNLAAYNPTDLTAGKAKVTIDGCGLSSIKQVYGGGNAASTPATEVTVNGTYEIEELFGGGNGADKLPSGSDNPGANVGFRAYLDNVEGKSDTPENRAANYGYGSGKAAVNVFGGTIHRVFGGSNTKGNVRKTAITMLEDKSECPFCVDEAYGGGKSAPMDAEAKLLMACIPGLKAVYGGAQAADVYDDVTLTITNGNFDRVFGGNNISGTIRGRIQVNIEETGCKPVIIGELYGGGNQAGYSVYGYNADGSLITSGDTPFYADPEVNVKSFTSIGNIYGGGYGTTATMVGNPIVNINEGEDATTDAQKHATAEYAGETITLEANTENEHQVTLPKHTKGKMGAINNVFGGGNAAEVIGNTNVNIGTQTEGYMTVSDTDITVGTTDVSNFYTRTGTTTATYVYTQASGTAKDGVTYYKKYNVKGADIRGNVYGGGNNAQVTGNTNVIIGKQAE